MAKETSSSDTAESETQPTIDMDAATAEISSELFGQGTDEENVDSAEGEGQKPSGTENADVVEAPPQEGKVKAEEVADNSAEVQETGAPKTWTKEALADWATIPPRAQQEILKREEDFFRGINAYKGAAELGQKYDAVVEPYKPALMAENVDPVQMFQSFAANHYLLSKGTPEQKIELAAQLIQGYNIPLPELLNFIADNGVEPVDPVITALEKKVTDLSNLISTAQTRNTEVATKRIQDEIEAFAQDPAHPHFNELAADIGKLFESGLATSLQDAYEKAVYANPKTRQLEIDRLTAEARTTASTEVQTRKDKIARSTADTVKVTPKSRDGTVPVGSIDDTLEETMAAINSRG